MNGKRELYRYKTVIKKHHVEAFKQAAFWMEEGEEVPPTYMAALDFQSGMTFQTLTEQLGFDPACVLHGSQSYEYIKPVAIDDEIEAIVNLIGISQKRNLTFAKIETTYIKNGAPAIRSKSVLIERKGDSHV